MLYYVNGMESGRKNTGGRYDNFCDSMALMRWSWIYSRAVSVEWSLQQADWH